MKGDKAIRWSTIAAVSIVALVAGFVSYRHALQVVTEHGETGWLGKAYPLTIDGLIYAASMVVLNAARRGLPASWLAYVALGLGIAATLTVNVAAGLAYGLVGALVAAWPAPALVISYELLMVVIRSGAAAKATTKATAKATRKKGGRSATNSAKAIAKATTGGIDGATSAVLGAIAQGQPVPSARALARVHHIGRDKAGEVRTAALNGHQAT